MGIDIKLPMKILEDNQATICIADNPINQKHIRYVDIRYHFVRDYPVNDISRTGTEFWVCVFFKILNL